VTQSYLPSRWLITSPQFANDPDIFPLLPGFSFIVSKKPIWSTGIQQAQSGRERRRMQWSYPIWSFKVGYEVLRDSATYAELQKLYAFFNSHAGRFQEFFFYDPSDNVVSGARFGTGDGATTAFQLSRTITGGAISFTEPVRGLAATPTVRVNGAMVGAPTGKNLCLWSEDFTNAAWIKGSGATVTANSAVAPDGTTTADTLTDPSASLESTVSQAVTVPNDTATYTGSIYVKKTTGATSSCVIECAIYGGTTAGFDCYFNTDTGAYLPAIPQITVTDAGAYWRVAVTATNNASGNTALTITLYPTFGAIGTPTVLDVTRTGSIQAWGAQLEQGAAATAYVPTTSSGGDYTIGPLGKITFNSAPAAAAALTWSGNFMFLCRFDDDSLDTAQMMNGLWSASGLSLIGVKS
jgi:uncharacterized protein (TIGR02217 family)